MDLDEDETPRLFYVTRTLMQMLKDRNYVVEDSEVDMTKQQFMDKYGGEEMMRRESNEPVITKAKKNDSSDKIYVFFPAREEVCFNPFDEKKKKVEASIRRTRGYLQRMNSDNVFRAIIVGKRKLSLYARIGLSELRAELPEFQVEFFLESELLVNVTEQVFVPKHQVLTDEEKKALLERYAVKESQLPRIQATDPIARYYGLKHGQVVRIIRPSETVGHYVTYRFCN